jgi:hypothetical protein
MAGVDLKAGLDDVEKRKFFTLPGLELRPSIVQPVASRFTDCAIPFTITFSSNEDHFLQLHNKFILIKHIRV